MISVLTFKRLSLSVGAAAALLLVSMAAEAALLTRGPYLQSGTPDSIVVRWRTDQSTDSVVRYGAAPSNLSSSASSPVSGTEHEITLNGLQPDSRYYYSIGDTSGVLAGGDPDHTFQTSPAIGTSRATRVWVIGDSGTADSNAAAVRDAYRNFTGSQDTELWLMLGDNAYGSGTDAQYQTAVFDMYPEMLRQVPLWPTLGNHDGLSANSAAQSGPYYDIFSLPRSGQAGGLSSGTEAYYSFDYGNIHFVCLDSHDSDRSADGTMLSWLVQDLLSTQKRWIIAFWHHPPYTKGSHDSDSTSDSSGRMRDMRENVLPILENHGVDLVLGGHSHSYERSFLLDGHYDVSATLTPSMVIDGGDGTEGGDGAYVKPGILTAPHAGAVYAVAGSSGKTSGGPLDHPAMYISLNQLGSMVLDIDGNRLDGSFLNSGGAVADRFTISKGPDLTAPAIETVTALDANTVSVLFSEQLKTAGAETVANYAIDPGITVNGASLAVDGRSVVLSTSTLIEGTEYTLSVANVTDLAGNPVGPASTAQFTLIVLVTQAFQDGVAPDAVYDGTRDTYLSQNAPDVNFGAAAALLVDGDDPSGSANDLSSLLEWDVSVIPPEALVESVSVTVNVFNSTPNSYELYALTRNWVEGEATWSQAQNASPWGALGATSAGDREPAVLGSLRASVTGLRTVVLNVNGKGVVQGWIDGSKANHGLIIADSAATDGVDFDSSEGTVSGQRPKLTVIYSLPPSGGDSTPPTVPLNLRSTSVTTNSAGLAWDPSTDDVGVGGYKIYRDGGMIDTSVSTGYTDSGLNPGTGYQYAVSAYDAANNESAQSATLAVSTDAESQTIHVGDIAIERRLNGKKWQLARSQVTILDGIDQPAVNAIVDIAWSGLVTATGSGVTGVGGSVTFDSPKTSQSASGQFIITVTGVQHDGSTYDAGQNIETSNCVDHTGASCAGTAGPPAPTGLSATPVTDGIQLDWYDSPDAEVTGYKVYRSTTSGTGYAEIASVPVSDYLDSSAISGPTYYYVVTAIDDSNAESPNSNEQSASLGGGTATQIHVADIEVAVTQQGKNWRGHATITIVDADSNPVAGASVSGEWAFEPLSGGVTALGSGGGTTDSGGTVVIQSSKIRAGSGDKFRFTVTDVALNGATYNSTANVETDDFTSVP